MASRLPQVYLRGEVDRGSGDALIRSREWVRYRRGALGLAPEGEPWERERERALGHAVAASRQIGGAVISDVCAALAHGLDVWRAPRIPSLILPRNPRSGLPRDVQRRTSRLDPGDVIELDGVLVTGLPRTLVDCACSLHPRDALVVVDSGMRRAVRPERREPRQEVEARAADLRAELLSRIAPGTRGAVQARAVIEAADPLAEIAPESVMRWIALSRGMPRPMLQREVTTSRGTFYTDMAWRFAIDGRPLWYHVEFDGSGKYLDNPEGRSTQRVLLDERKRESSITATGDKVLRIYSDEIGREDHVFSRITGPISRALAAGYRRVPALYRPPGL